MTQDLRSRSKSRVLKRAPGGVISVHYRKLRLRRSRCAICDAELGGVPRDYGVLSSWSRSSKRPERPYGGQLCHRCLEMLLKVSIRSTSS